MRSFIKYITLFLFIAFIFSSCKKSNEAPLTGNRIGNLMSDFKLKNEVGDLISLSDFRGKPVLVEFCASWCSYCIKEFPELNQIYSEYKQKGFEIISLSIDEDHDAWLNMIQEYSIQYVRVNEPQGFDSPLIEIYGVESIPKMILVDKDGIILLITTKASEVRQAVAKRL